MLERIRPLGALVPQLIAHRPDPADGVIVTARVAGAPPAPALASPPRPDRVDDVLIHRDA